MHHCSVTGCDTGIYALGLCNKHWDRLRRTGTTDPGPKAPGTLEERFWRKVDKRGPDECWPWLANTCSGGYGRISRGKKGEGAIGAHVASYEIATGQPVPVGMVVMHSCDNPICVNPAHLSLGTYAINTADMIAKGRKRVVAPVGQDNGKAILDEEKVRYIRASAKNNAELGRELGVSVNAVRGVRTGRTWRHVE